MRCAICGQAIRAATEPIVPTTMGDLVHVACADREARAAYRRRTSRAVLSIGLALILLSFAARSGIRGGMLVLLLAVVAVNHLFLNWRWWRLSAPWLRSRRRRR